MPKMRGAMWWIDRWRQSTACTDMTAEEQGLYRNLLDEVWVRDGHVIPDDPRILARVSMDPEAWARCGEKVLGWMKRVEGGWTNDTALEVIHQAERRAEKQARYRAKCGNAPGNEEGNAPGNEAGSPSPSPSQEQEQNEHPPTPRKRGDPLAPSVQAVFEAWRETLNHPEAKLTPKRRKHVEARLRDGYTVEQLVAAINGCRASPYHQGENETGTVYDDLELICRSGEKVEAFLARLKEHGGNGGEKPPLTTEEKRARAEERQREWDAIREAAEREREQVLQS